MPYRPLMTAFAVIAAIGGIACLAIPDVLLASFGVELSAMGLVIYRFWGAALLGLGMMAWIARGSQNQRRRLGFASALAIANLLAAIIAVLGQYAGANAAGWSNVALFSLVAMAFAWTAIHELR